MGCLPTQLHSNDSCTNSVIGLISRIRMTCFKILLYLCVICFYFIRTSNADDTSSQPVYGLFQRLFDTGFQCSSGENIAQILICDGTKNCADGSDENMKACRSKYPNACTSPENVTSILITSCNVIVKTSKGDLFQEFTLASSPSRVNVGRGYLQLICINGTWISPHDDGNHISEKCERLPTRSRGISLYYSNGNKVNDNNAHFTGTVIYPTCDSRGKGTTFPQVKDATCEETNEWSVDSLNCVVCSAEQHSGYLARPLIEVTSSGRTVVCQVHFVSPYLILTAASCFNQSSSSEYYVYLDFYRNTVDFMDQSKMVKIEKIHYYASPQEERSNHPALAEVKDRLSLSKNHSFVCLDWNEHLTFPMKIYEGWGAPVRNKDDPKSDALYLHLKPCNQFSYFSKDHYSANKSCNEFGNNNYEMKKGAGLYMHNGGSYFLRDIVIDTVWTPNYTLVFTDLWKYFGWINTTIVATNRDYPNVDVTTPQIAQLYEKDGVISFHDFELGCGNGDTGVKFDNGCDLPEDIYLDYDIGTSATKYKSYDAIATNTKSNVPEFSALRNIKCKDGNSLNSPNTQSAVCFQGTWLPQVPQC